MEWINLNDERPEIAEWVLGLCSRGSYWLCFRANGGWYINTGNGQIFVWNKNIEKEIEIQYWLPIPKIPKELFDRLFQIEPIICPDCGGSGIVVGTTQGCCGNYNPDGSCCGISIPEPIQEQCARCETTGYIKA